MADENRAELARRRRRDALERRRAGLSAVNQELLDRKLHGRGVPRSASYPDAVTRMASFGAKSALDVAWADVVQAARERASRVPEGVDLRRYLRELETLNHLAVVAVSTLFDRHGLFTLGGRSHAREEVFLCLTVAPGFRRLVTRWLRTLAHLGLLARDGDTFTAGHRLLDAAIARCGDAWTSVQQDVERTCSEVAAVITGKTHGLESFSMRLRGADSGSDFFEAAVQAYERHPYSHYLNDVIVAVIEQVRHRPLRVLEIGAGVGGTTRPVLDALRGADVEYVFTDVSSGFLTFAAQRFEEHRFISYARLDINEFPAGVYPAEAFDVVLGGNSLHCAARASETLGRLSELLVDRGLLLLREGNVNSPYLLVSQGLQTGASDYEDERLLDDAGPLLPPERWQALCREAGFEGIAGFPEPGQALFGLDESILVAARGRRARAAPEVDP